MRFANMAALSEIRKHREPVMVRVMWWKETCERLRVLKFLFVRSGSSIMAALLRD